MFIIKQISLTTLIFHVDDYQDPDYYSSSYYESIYILLYSHLDSSDDDHGSSSFYYVSTCLIFLKLRRNGLNFALSKNEGSNLILFICIHQKNSKN